MEGLALAAWEVFSLLATVKVLRVKAKVPGLNYLPQFALEWIQLVFSQ